VGKSNKSQPTLKIGEQPIQPSCCPPKKQSQTSDTEKRNKQTNSRWSGGVVLAWTMGQVLLWLWT